MKKEYRIAIGELFTAELQRIDPQFRKIPVQVMCKYDGELAFAKKVEKVTLFISVIPNPKGYEEFAIEIGWSKKNQFPDLTMRPNILSPTNSKEFQEEEGMIRLASFSGKSSFGWTFRGIDAENTEKYFSGIAALRTTPKEIIEQDLRKKSTKDEAIEAVKNAVNDAIAELTENGLPYFERLLNNV